MANLQIHKLKKATKRIILVALVLSIKDCLSSDLSPINSISSVPMIRIKMAGAPSYLDETVIYYQTGASSGFDSEFDSYKIQGPNPVPQISQNWNNTLIAINGVPPVSPTFSTYINVTTPISKTFTITAADFDFLPAGTCVYLNDLYTGITTNLLQTPYTFFLHDTTIASRFSILITHFEQLFTSNLTQPSCQLINGGKIKITGNNNAPWNYVWKDSTNTIIKSSIGLSTSDSIQNLSEGNYKVEIYQTNNTCYYAVTNFTINKVSIPIVNFISPDSINTNSTFNFNLINQSSNCTNFEWDFGDGVGHSNDFEPTYSYLNSGVFSIKLKGYSQSGCMDSTTKIIKVEDVLTGINSLSKKNIELCMDEYDNYSIKINQPLNTLDLTITTLTGSFIKRITKNNLSKNDVVILNINEVKSGIYLLDATLEDSSHLSYKIFKN